MAKKFVYSKGFGGVSDFVYIDLLPDVKRSRQFNVNVIIALTIAVVASFVFIYMPYSNATATFEESNGLNNDLKHELLLTQEEYAGYEIDLDALAFQAKIDAVVDSKTDFMNLKDDLEFIVDGYNGTLSHITFNANTRTINVTIQMTSLLMYDSLNGTILNVPWVTNSVYGVPSLLSNGVMYQSTFTIGVDENAK